MRGNVRVGVGRSSNCGRGARAGGLALLALAELAFAASAQAAVTPGVNGKIAYGDFGGSIHVMGPDGSNPRELTSSSTDEWPAFSPDARRIAFTSQRDGAGRELYVMNADGSAQTRLTDDEADLVQPAFSPDGRRIVFSLSGDLVIANADGTGQTPLGHAGGSPAFSPDGKRIAFSSYEDGDLEIFVIDADGTNRTRLTDNAALDHEPVFSPDGKKIAFSSLRDGNREIYVMTASGAGQTRLTYDAGTDTQPSFSPDGKRIAFASTRHGGDYDVFVMDTDGGRQTRLTSSSEDDVDPDWGSANPPCQGRTATIAGTDAADVLAGSVGDDVIFAGAGNDTVKGLEGADALCGGDGRDTASYRGHQGPVTVDLFGATADDGGSEDGPAGARDSVGADFERLIGGFGDDVLLGNSGANLLTGGAGDDLLRGGFGNDTLRGGSGDDELRGEDRRDRLAGDTGDDTLRGGEGDDELDGGADADLLDGGPGADLADYANRTLGIVVTLGAGAGNDGSAEDGPAGLRDTVLASVENLWGTEGADRLTGSAAGNLLVGDLGKDELFGLAGFDILDAKDGIADKVIDCGAGTDNPALTDPVDPAPVSCP